MAERGKSRGKVLGSGDLAALTEGNTLEVGKKRVPRKNSTPMGVPSQETGETKSGAGEGEARGFKRNPLVVSTRNSKFRPSGLRQGLVFFTNTRETREGDDDEGGRAD